MLNIPAVQSCIASGLANELEKTLATKVSIGKVDVGLFNRIIIDDVQIYDQQKRDMFNCHRLSAKINIFDLINGKINIYSAQLFGMRVNLVKPSDTQPLNCQFVIDSLASKDTTSSTPLDLHIGSLVVRNSSVNYNHFARPHSPGVIDPNHVSLSKISGHIILYALTDDSVSLNLKRLSMLEEKSGLNLKKLSFDIKANKRHCDIDEFELETTNSSILAVASASYDGKKISSAKCSITNSGLFIPELAFLDSRLANIRHFLTLSTTLSYDNNILDVKSLSLNDKNSDLRLQASGTLSSFKPLNINARIKQLHFGGDIANDILTSYANDQIASMIRNMQYVNIETDVKIADSDVSAEGIIGTGIGNIKHYLSFKDNKVNASLITESLKLGQILESSGIGDVSGDIKLTAITDKSFTNVSGAELTVNAPLITFNGYPYSNINFFLNQTGTSAIAKLNISDPNLISDIDILSNNVTALIKGDKSIATSLDVSGVISSINPNNLKLTSLWPSTTFSTTFRSHIDNILHPIDNTEIELSAFNMQGQNEKKYSFDSLHLVSSLYGGVRSINLSSDFADVSANGEFDFKSLVQSFTNLIASKLPTLSGIAHATRQDNVMNINADIRDTQILDKLFGIDIISNEPILLSGYINDRLNNAELSISAPSIAYNGTIYDNTQLSLTSPNDTLMIHASTARREDHGGHSTLNIESKAADNTLYSNIGWDNGNGNDMRGTLKARTQFLRNNANEATASIQILPSDIMMGDTLWHINPSAVVYSKNYLKINNFLVNNNTQHIHINGTTTTSPNDRLTIDLKDVNVAYIMNLINFHSVDFAGHASGTATLASLFDTPEAEANLSVRNFTFETGRMGTLKVKAQYNSELGQIDIDGLADDNPGNTKIDGYVSIKHNYIDLDIQANKTRAEFLESFCGSFLDDVDIFIDGRLRLAGDLKAINLTGQAVTNGTTHVSTLNTTYELKNDTITLIPDEIIFNADTLYDIHGNKALLSGALHHKHLTRMTFDLNVKADHLLCYDFPTLDNSTFCGHVIASGNCAIKGRPTEITFDIDATPHKGTEIVYNVSSPDALQNQEFITWRQAETTDENYFSTEASSTPIVPDEMATNIRLNFIIHTTPDATLRLIMDEHTGDYIALNGSGTLRANYYNKGAMQIFGNYNVDHGEYRMTIQQVITKNFEFLSGGSIVFGGDPFESAINLQAQYVVPSVSLSDLNIGQSFNNNTVKVNCLMNITGTAAHPQVDFDLNLPQASTDIQQMITSLIESDDTRNQQVLYLLSIGRFYSVGNTAMENGGQSQTSLAMQSFLSGTLSQQLNNIISDVVLKNKNWNFGANISPGDEGMNNAEYEGLVNGRLLNNRLLINGQFGYRDNVNATTSFIGDFDVRYLLFPNGNLSVRVYNQTTDRYFTKNSLNTQGIGIVLKHDFNSILPSYLRRRKK